MNQEHFQKYVEQTRDCDAALLAAAVNKGIIRAKGDRLDVRKFIGLAAMCAVTAAMFFGANSELATAAASEFLPASGLVAEGNAEALYEYLSDLASTIIRYLGGS